jgi:transcriptional regulator with XRE-family HTH domain
MPAGKALRHWAIDAGLSLKEIAAAIGVTRVALSRYLHGRRKPKVDHCVAIATLTRGAVPVEMWTDAAKRAA